MTKLILNSSFKRAFKLIIKRRPDLKTKIEAKLRLLAEDPKIRLPCFEPVEHDFPPKIITRMFLNDWEGINHIDTISVEKK